MSKNTPNNTTTAPTLASVPVVETYRFDQETGEKIITGKRFLFGPEDLRVSDLRKAYKRDNPKMSNSLIKNKVAEATKDHAELGRAYALLVHQHAEDHGLIPSFANLRENKKGIITGLDIKYVRQPEKAKVVKTKAELEAEIEVLKAQLAA